jgi:hypothetical protein
MNICTYADIDCTVYDYQTAPGLDRASSARRQNIQTDAGEYKFVQEFPSRTSARTTFHARDAQDQQKWNRLWKYQHVRGQTDDGAGKETVRDEAYARHCKTILCQCEVPNYAKSKAIDRVFRTSLQGFSRHYGGYDGACVGFALLAMFDDPGKAKESFYAEQASTLLAELMSGSVEALIDYTFGKYGGQ